MKTWKDIVKAIRTKLFLSSIDTADDYTGNASGNNRDNMASNYGEEYAVFANECLNMIANSVKPNDTFVVVDTDDLQPDENGAFLYELPEDFISFNGSQHQFRFGKHAKKPEIYQTPWGQAYIEPQSMSEIYCKNPDQWNPALEIKYVDGSHILLPVEGEYKIFYNGLWEDVPPVDEFGNILGLKKLNIPQSILQLIPSYVAAQVLSEDDLQRSMVLKNEFELMFSRLDDTVYKDSQSYVSKDGWV